MSAGPANEARFAPGARVRVKEAKPERIARMHLRTPHYVRGREGVVTRVLGSFKNPEDLAFARPAEFKMLYHVEFEQPPIWEEGKPGDTLMVELYEHWLEPAA